MTMMCPLDRIRMYYLFICLSTVCENRRSDSVSIGDVYLRGDMYGSEREKVLWSKRQSIKCVAR